MTMGDFPGQGTSSKALRCPACGGANFRWGKVAGHLSLWFLAEPERKKIFAAEPETRARLCTRCGNVQFFLNVD